MDQAALSNELNTDPTSLGYKNTDGTWKTATQIAVILTTPIGTVANPTPQANIPQPFTYADIKALLSDASLVNLKASSLLPRILDDINSDNRNVVIAWAQLLYNNGTSSTITLAEQNSIISLMQSTIADPNYSATVPGPCRIQTLFNVGAISEAQITSITGVA